MARYSIIVPVYKVEQYLEKCVDSILGQTFQDFELILVDDGSPDHCGDICDHYARQDIRVQVIHKENGGVSTARNHGIQAATGEYLTFVDADDFISPDFLWNAEEILRSEPDADFIQFGWRSFVEGADPDMTEISDPKVSRHEKKNAMCDFLKFQKFTHAPWGKIVHCSLIQENMFPVGIKVGEDLHVSYQLLGSAQHIVSTEAVAYFYCIREGSAMTSRKPSAVVDAFRVFGWMYEYFQTNYPELKRMYTLRYVNDLMQLLRDLEHMENSKQKNQIKKDIRIALAATPDAEIPQKAALLKRLALWCPPVYFAIYKFKGN